MNLYISVQVSHKMEMLVALTHSSLILLAITRRRVTRRRSKLLSMATLKGSIHPAFIGVQDDKLEKVLANNPVVETTEADLVISY